MQRRQRAKTNSHGKRSFCDGATGCGWRSGLGISGKTPRAAGAGRGVVTTAAGQLI
ncbi:hypothetical protein ppKF707_3526 [Metapseudomonas furukawaii]|uniref:Uncharacterized protein n=1 Tax=Metapseudomonas furukawaii TaxID=1149133 RepID=A0AAD1FE12_METFU|nr:hypothetical protein ppKF707_3526 [Pseudomonas furukawaii]BAU72701.1 hypothetical protein KF707C_10130 [Pseudomonas furukawaii]